MSGWTDFFLGELGAAAALAGLLFVSVSVNQVRILELGRMADRGLEALTILLLVLVVASLPLIPGQPMRLLGGEIVAASAAVLVTIVKLQHGYLRNLEAVHRPRAMYMVWLDRGAVLLMLLAGATLAWRNDADGLYLLPPGVLLSFTAAGANAWVLLVEINR